MNRQGAEDAERKLNLSSAFLASLRFNFLWMDQNIRRKSDEQIAPNVDVMPLWLSVS
jgi:hypothetical protein